MKRKALVSGAAGFIGSVLCKKLKETGWLVDAWDIKEIKHNYYNHIFNFRKEEEVRRHSIINSDYDVIFHLGAHSLLGPSVNDPLKYYQNNVSNMADFLENLKNQNWKGAFIFASSAATYGDLNTSLKLTEGLAGKAINPYGSTKVVGEMMLRESCRAYKMKAYSMRFFNVAGSYDDVGQAIDQPHILTKMSMASIKNKTFYINGKNYHTYDGTCVRDYIHVIDVCNALIMAAEHLYTKDEGTYDAFNVCSGVMVSNYQLLDYFSDLYPIQFEYSDIRPGDPGYLVGDPNKIYKTIGFRPEFNLHEIIKTHYDYTLRNINHD